MAVAEKTRRKRKRASRSARPNESNSPPTVPPSVRHPISRWYLMPLARVVVTALTLSPLTRSRIRPTHITLAGLVFAAMAAAVLLWRPDLAAIAAVFVLAAWFCDRVDGMLARRQATDSAWGAWLDANVDELVDLGLQTALAAAASQLTGSQWPWLLLAAFLAGKYLFAFGLSSEPSRPGRGPAVAPAICQSHCRVATRPALLRRLYHLPGNADVRVHFLVVMLLCGWFTAELAVVAVYYNLRWMVRYPLAARRLGGGR